MAYTPGTPTDWTQMEVSHLRMTLCQVRTSSPIYAEIMAELERRRQIGFSDS